MGLDDCPRPNHSHLSFFVPGGQQGRGIGELVLVDVADLVGGHSLGRDTGLESLAGQRRLHAHYLDLGRAGFS